MLDSLSSKVFFILFYHLFFFFLEINGTPKTLYRH